MPTLNTSKTVRWNPADYLTMAKAMGPLLAQGMTLQEASQEAIQTIPAARRFSISTLTASSTQMKLRKVILENKIATEEALKKAAKASRFGNVKWTEREWALIARRVRHWRDTLQDKRTTPKQVHAAAAIELPEDRQRGFNSIQASTVAGLEKALKAAWVKQDLLATIPFDAAKKKFEKMVNAAHGLPTPAEPAKSNTPSKAIHSPQAAPKPSASTQATPTPQKTPQTPPQAGAELPLFVMHAGPGFDAAVRSIVMEVVKAELATAFTQGIADVTGQLSAQLQSGMANMLNQFLEAKPGDIIEPPPPPVVVHTPPEADHAASLHDILLPQLDVVGLIGPQVTVVKNALNGHASRVRFIESQHVDSWDPRKCVILNTKFIGHNAEFRCKKAGVKPIRVSGGAEAVLKALNTLHQQQVELANVQGSAH